MRLLSLQETKEMVEETAEETIEEAETEKVAMATAVETIETAEDPLLTENLRQALRAARR